MIRPITHSALFLLIFTTAISAQKKPLEIQDIYTDMSLRGKSGYSSLQFYEGGSSLSFLKMQDKKLSVFKLDPKNGEEMLLVAPENLIPEGEKDPISIASYTWSADSKFILFTGSLPARSLKTGGGFYIYSVADKKIVASVHSEQEQSNIELSPDGKLVAFVRGNDLYVYSIADKKETRLTSDGSETILNGHFDWVYEEEFSIIKAYEWSPDSKTLAFWRLDQSNVPVIEIAKYDSLYLNKLVMRYPKAGAPNSIVKIGVVPVTGGKTVWADLGAETDIYIPRIKFTQDPSVLSIQRLNRLQNKWELLFCNTGNGSTKVILTEESKGWIDISNELYFLKNNDFLYLSEKNGYAHIYLYNTNKGSEKQVTTGNYEVSKINGIDENAKKIFFSANKEHTIFKDLYVCDFSGSSVTRLTQYQGTHSVTMNSSCTMYLDRYSNANEVSSLVLVTLAGNTTRTLLASDMSGFEKYKLTPVEFFAFTTSDGVELNGYMTRPVGYDVNKKYPVLVYNYSGPGSQTVTDSWGGGNYLWHQVLANKGYCVVAIDNRGTGGRGTAFKFSVYKNLGSYEVSDQRELKNYLATLGFIDTTRMGIWGWSYGGYTSALNLVKSPDVFKMAISVAPVTHWKFYDNIYTERYMSLPALNSEGYEKSSVLAYTQNLKGKLLLVHGTADDNVHFQNSVVLADKFISENKPFETMFYPEKNHGIFGGKTRQHLFTMLTEFVLKNL